MADSDNSRSLPVVTRRRLLSTSAAWLAAQAGDVVAALPPEYNPTEDSDPVLNLWQQWKSAHDRVEKLCRKQQRLENKLIAAVGFPCVDIAVPGQECTIVAFTMDDIDRHFINAPHSAAAKMRAKTAFAERQAVWDALDEKIGYSSAKRAEEEVHALREQRLNELFAQPAQSIAGVVAKLHAILVMAEEDGPCDELPWPQFRALLIDLIGI